MMPRLGPDAGGEEVPHEASDQLANTGRRLPGFEHVDATPRSCLIGLLPHMKVAPPQ